MSSQDVEIVRRLFAEQAQTGQAALEGTLTGDHPSLSLWHPECVLEELSEMPDAAAYEGREGIARYFRQLPELWESFSYTPAELRGGPDGVIVATDLRGSSKAGATVDLRVYQVFRLRDEMIVYATGYLDRDQALAAVGLAS